MPRRLPLMWRRVLIAWLCVVAMLLVTTGASAASSAPAKPHQGTFEFFAALNVYSNPLATVEAHTGNSHLATTGTSDVPDAARGMKAINLPAWRKVTVDMAHIIERHLPGAKYSAGRTVFPSTMNERGIARAIREAYKSSTKVGVQGADRVLLQGQGRGLTIEIWFNKATKTIDTAYPVTP